MVRRPPASSPFPHTTPFRLKTEPVHPASLYSVKLIVPVGLVPRVRCATSDTCPPAATEPLAVVESAGAAFAGLTAPGLIVTLLLGESRFMWKFMGNEAAPLPGPTGCPSNTSLGAARCPPQSTNAVALPVLLMETIVCLSPAPHVPCPPTSVTELTVTLTPLNGPLVDVMVPPGAAARLVLKGARNR